MTDLAAPTPPTLGIYPIEVYRRLPRSPQRWVIEGLLPTGGWMNVYSPPKRGKSYIAMQIATAIAGGEEEWLGFGVHTHGPVIYLQLDTPRGEWAERCDDLVEGGGLALPADALYTCDKSCVPYPFNILDPPTWAWLHDHCQRIKPVVVIVDTWRDCFRGEENDPDLTHHVISLLDAAIRPAAGVLIAHARKEQFVKGQPLSPSVMNDMRGSSAVNARMDTVVALGRSKLSYEGRSVAPATLKLKRLPNQQWALDRTEIDSHLKAVLADSTLDSIKGRARALSERTGLTFEACRSLVRRRGEGGSGPGGVKWTDPPPPSP